MKVRKAFYGIAEHTVSAGEFSRLSTPQIIERGMLEYEILESYFKGLTPVQVLEALNHFNHPQTEF